MKRHIRLLSLTLAMTLGLSIVTISGCGGNTSATKGEMPKEKPNMGQPPAPPPLPPPPK
jgi:hypothetical protein